MSEWKVRAINVELEKKKASLIVTSDNGVHLNINQLAYDEPGQQTEGEMRKLALKAAREALQDLLENPPK